VATYGIGFFSSTTTSTPARAPTSAPTASEAGLLDHNRPHLAWLDSVLDRHPACARELQLRRDADGFRAPLAAPGQSTSDQQDPVRYPPIAAAPRRVDAPSRRPLGPTAAGDGARGGRLRAGDGLLGRLYVSGYLNRCRRRNEAWWAEAVAASGDTRPVAQSLPFWPLGLPTDSSLGHPRGLRGESSALVTVWNRSVGTRRCSPCRVHRRRPPGRDGLPRSLTPWDFRWDRAAGVDGAQRPVRVGARTIRVRRRP